MFMQQKEMTMSRTKFMLLGAFASLALAGPVLAQGEGASITIRPNSGLVINPNGQARAASLPDNMETAMQNAKEISGTAILMHRGGKMYLIDDHRMPDGRMMSEHMR